MTGAGYMAPPLFNARHTSTRALRKTIRCVNASGARPLSSARSCHYPGCSLWKATEPWRKRSVLLPIGPNGGRAPRHQLRPHGVLPNFPLCWSCSRQVAPLGGPSTLSSYSAVEGVGSNPKAIGQPASSARVMISCANGGKSCGEARQGKPCQRPKEPGRERLVAGESTPFASGAAVPSK